MSELRVNTISENTSGNGVAIDSVTLKDGGATLTDNITFSASGKGVHLGVTSATASNLLDDYEEGSFTPVLRDNDTGGNTASISSSTAQYVKIGRMVYIAINMFNINKSGMTSSNVLYLTGLPFTSAGTSNNGMFSRHPMSVEVDSIDFTGYVTADATAGGFTRMDFHDNVDSAGDTQLTVSDITTSSDSDILINGWYLAV
tara:strand:- start:650 stop:1252 length:603 start_codon:yes stop_codon:yes gene_type:complete